MERKLYTIDEVISFILEGKKLVLTADESSLDKLPKGNWIGGTSPYFMDETEGVFTKNKIFVDDFTDLAKNFKIEAYNKNTLKNIASNSYKNGFVLLIIPNDTEVHTEFAINSLSYKNIFNNPVVGYIAGYDLKNITKSKVYNGLDLQNNNDNAISIHIELPDNKIARAEIVNLDTIDKSSPEIKFPKNSFVQSACTIDGKEMNIAEFFIQNNYNGLPIIANNNGAFINKDIRKIDSEKNKVLFYSPVFSDESYYLVNIIDNYKKI